MPGNGKVFISHAHEDNDRCAPLLAALDAWGVDYWFDTQRMDAGTDLLASVQKAITERDIFIRVGTKAALNSYWMNKELSAFMGLQARDHQEGQAAKRLLIPFRFEPEYQFQPMELGTIYIDASDNHQHKRWVEELRRALALEDRRANRLEIDQTGAYFEEETSTRWRCKTNGKVIRDGMLATYRSMESLGNLFGLTALGLPVEDEYLVVDGVTVQRFERGILVRDPEGVYDEPPGRSGRYYLAHIEISWHADKQRKLLQGNR